MISVAVFYPATLFANTSALPTPAPGVQNSSVSTPLETASPDSLKVQAVNVRGQAFVQHGGKGDFESLAEKQELVQGDIVRTGEGLCHLLIGGKSQIYIEPNTTLTITEVLKNSNKSESTKLTLQGGKLKVSLPNLKNGSSFEVTTPTAVATVRGTLFYMFVGKIQDKLMSELYVDKSDGGVLLKNIFSGDSTLVPHHSLSNASEDGKLEEPKKLTPEEQKEYVDQWESLGGASQQFGIETIPLIPPPPPSNLGGFTDSLAKDNLNDALIDRFVNQNIAGENNEISQDTTSSTDGTDAGGQTGGGETGGGETGGGTEPVMTDADKLMVLNVVNATLEAQQSERTDAQLATVEDAQTGKVFTDVHGNRVRVDQYITQTSSSSIGFLSLTLREGTYQPGITSVFFFTQFNRELTEADGSFRDLPWNDYMNVVTNEDFTGLSTGDQYDQYIVHEHYTTPDGPDPGPGLYPTEMFAAFTSAVQAGQTSGFGAIIFDELYSTPFRATSDQGEFWLQGRDEDSTTIVYGDEATIEIIKFTNHATQPSQTIVNGSPSFTVSDPDRTQSAGFASSAGIADLDTLAGINFFRNNAIHPASFSDQYGAERVLTAYFLPINDAGQVFDAPGFRLRGMRDIIRPNTLVNPGGNYNLELLFVYGELAPNGLISREIFRIDAIITPEIFVGSPESGPGFGLKGLNDELVTDTVFPSTLELDE